MLCEQYQPSDHSRDCTVCLSLSLFLVLIVPGMWFEYIKCFSLIFYEVHAYGSVSIGFPLCTSCSGASRGLSGPLITSLSLHLCSDSLPAWLTLSHFLSVTGFSPSTVSVQRDISPKNEKSVIYSTSLLFQINKTTKGNRTLTFFSKLLVNVLVKLLKWQKLP